MKKRFTTQIITMMFCGVILALSITEAVAHPAIAFLTYDDETEELTVSIFHEVASPTSHYVSSVAITVNSVLNSSKTYASQPNDSEFNYTYSLLVVDGDVVSVTVECNEGGEYTATITIGEETTTSTDDPSETDDGDSIPEYTLVAMFLALMTLGALFRHISRHRQR